LPSAPAAAALAQGNAALDRLVAAHRNSPALREDPELATATAQYETFDDVRAEILSLSRQNTNVRSLSISLNQKRTAMLVCQGALSELQQVILQEPIAGTTYGGRVVRPR
jgi:hypothetical protein